MNSFKVFCFAVIAIIASSCITSSSLINIPKGTWKMVAMEQNGQKLPVKPICLTFTGNRFKVVLDNAVIESGTTAFNTSTSPMQYDVVMDKDMPGKQKRFHAIYKIKDGIMTACINIKPGGSRPKDFTTAKGTPCRLVTWEKLITTTGKGD